MRLEELITRIEAMTSPHNVTGNNVDEFLRMAQGVVFHDSLAENF